MRILILGVSGLIGHKLLHKLSPFHKVYGTLHKKKINYQNLELFASSNVIENIDVLKFKDLEKIITKVNPNVILNCVGITKRKITKDNIQNVIEINSVFPHKLANWTANSGIKLIHFSTDCVFNGEVGNYSDQSLTDAKDIYGRTKAMGEINYNHTLTLRSSFVGQELFDKTELLDWFLSQENSKINGFRNVLYSGVSTNFMCKFTEILITNYADLNGIYNLALENPISKFDLLSIAKKIYNLDVEIIEVLKPVHKPTLDGSKLRKITGIAPPSWEIMMSDLELDRSLYK